MMRDIHQQILLLERFQYQALRLLRGGYDLQGRGCNAGLGDVDAPREIVGADVLGELAHLFYADRRFGGEVDPDGADLGERMRVGFCG